MDPTRFNLPGSSENQQFVTAVFIIGVVYGHEVVKNISELKTKIFDMEEMNPADPYRPKMMKKNWKNFAIKTGLVLSIPYILACVAASVAATTVALIVLVVVAIFAAIALYTLGLLATGGCYIYDRFSTPPQLPPSI